MPGGKGGAQGGGGCTGRGGVGVTGKLNAFQNPANASVHQMRGQGSDRFFSTPLAKEGPPP